MNSKVNKKFEIIRGVSEGIYTVKTAAILLGLTVQRIKQLRDGFQKEGDSVFIHGNSGKHPAIYRFNEEFKAKIVSLKKSQRYNKTNFTDFHKLLLLNESIKISYTALLKILKEAGISSIMGHHTERKSFKWRKRCRHFGELLQIGTDLYDWFECGSPCVLHIIIDDATGILTGLYFCPFECHDGYLSVLHQTFTKYGIPMSICSSMPGLFNQKEISKKNIDNNVQSKTFLGEFIENRLGIEIINIDANQGRRCHEVLCDILHDNMPSWLKSQGIINIEQANKQIFRYIDIFNSNYSISTKNNNSLFIPLNSDDFNLNYEYSHVNK